MEGDWDGVILRQYNRYVLSWRPKGFSGVESGSPTFAADYGTYLGVTGNILKRKVVYLIWEKGTGKA